MSKPMQYDYIIAGGGTSGSLIAAKLAGQGARILVLEAGGSDRNPLIQMPAGYVKLLNAARYMWFFQSVRQEQLDGRMPIIPSGRVIGGGSSVNAMVYIRGQSIDYDRWVEATGDEGWRYERLLPYFRAIEGNNRFNDELHGSDGPMKVSDPLYINDLSRAYVMAAQDAGLPFKADFNRGQQTGTGFFQLNTHKGRRCSAADAFLYPAAKTGLIDILSGCLVHSVKIDGSRARGVVFSRNGQIIEAQAGAEVVLCAGAIATPKILMLSGIGPQEHLKQHGIGVRVDRAGVGENLQDHTEVPVLAFCNGKYGYFGQDRGWNQIRNGLQYMLFKSGPVTSNGVEAGSFFDPDDVANDAKIQQFCVPSVYLDRGTSDLKPSYGITLNSCVLRPASRGSVRLAGSDPAAQPLVNPNYLSDPEDLRLSIAGLRQARRILSAAPLRHMIDREIFPGVGQDSDEALALHAKAFVKTVYHPVGTARMGREDDPLAVVTSDLKLIGVDNLRIGDTSIMPNIISGNTNSTTLVIAAKAAEAITGRQVG
jgi:choline dehydrogenase-like flavoprotein